jgi:diguanylate cyclase (GGDEF)-like protein
MLTKIEYMNKYMVAFVGSLLVVWIAFVDNLTGKELSFSLFYLLPVFWFTWLIGKRAGMVTSALCALIWYSNEALSGQIYSHPGIYFWNSSIRFGFFMIVNLLLAKLKQILAQEAALARYDFLTGATNSRYFYELLLNETDRARRYQHPFTLAYIDVDNFKKVNDSLGHQIGDQVLASVAETARANLRRSDVVGRLGGDEFVLLLPETDPQMAKAAIQKTQTCLLNTMRDHQWPVTFSIGVVTLENTSLNPDEIIKMGDDLMYQVKAEGKNAIRYAIYKDLPGLGPGIAVTPRQPMKPRAANLACARDLLSEIDFT